MLIEIKSDSYWYTGLLWKH